MAGTLPLAGVSAIQAIRTLEIGRGSQLLVLGAAGAVGTHAVNLATHLGAFDQPWLMAKLGLVLLLSGYQGWIASYGRKLAGGRRELEDRSLRIMNEVPGILTALIVVLVIVRPF